MKLPPLPMPDGTLYGPDRTIKGHAYLASSVRAWAEAAIEAAIEQARKEEREAWSKWADAVVAELELRAKINNDPYLEISRLRFVELDTLRARKS